MKGKQKEAMEMLIEDDKLHEECGVFGIYAPAGHKVARSIYYGLLALQHRGQEAAGIAVSDTEGPKGSVKLKKGMGLVSEVFHKQDMEALCGNIGVGHVRYSTTGGSTPENTQPFAMQYLKGSLAIVHNGNLINADKLKRAQVLRGLAHYTTSDSEVLAYEIIGERVKTDSIEAACENAAKRLKGGYAVVLMSPRKLVGIRDPFGIKPLVLGKKGDCFILASESAAITAVGGNVVRDIRPGEIVTITREGVSASHELCGGPCAHCIFEYIYFARSDSVMDGISVHEARMKAGRALARENRVEADLVTGVPESGLAAAEGYAAESGIPFALAFHKNSYVGRSFIKPTEEERNIAVQMKLSAFSDVVRGKRIVLIDDSIVRGTTMRHLIVMLKEAGAREVHVRISSPPFLYPCYYGTDVPTAGQLIASGNTEETVREYVGADSLAYLKVEDFEHMTGDLALCRACFDAQYPVES